MPTSREFADSTGSTVVVETVGAYLIHSYTIRIEGHSSAAGRADYLEPEGDERTRIFFHTEVGPGFTGRGLAGLLIRTALADAVEEDIVVVPVCPLFAAHLRKHGDDFVAGGGRFRAPRPADLELVGRALRTS